MCFSGSASLAGTLGYSIVGGTESAEFHKYTLVWAPTSVKVYLDGALVASHNEHIPQSPAYIILQHRGTNSDEWGGTAMVGVTRYMYVKKVNFTQLSAPKR